MVPELRPPGPRPRGRTHEEKVNAPLTTLSRTTVTVPAYAKINLTLELLGVRPDGYHDLRSVVVPVELHDDVEISVSPASGDGRTVFGQNLSLETIADGVSLANLGPAEKNLAVRAARLFLDSLCESKSRDVSFCIPHSAFCIHLTKRIPLGGGLGGGSADAAAVLRGLNTLLPSLAPGHSPLATSELMEMGAELGSDIPAMVHGGTVLMEGRGERVSPLRGPDGRSPLPPLFVLLANPGTHVSTAEAYRETSAVLTSPAFSCNILCSPHCVGSASAFAAWLFNGLEGAVFARHPEVAALAARLREAGAPAVLMSGSGATVFALFDDAASAERVRRGLPPECWCTVTRLLPDGVMAAHGPLEA